MPGFAKLVDPLTGQPLQVEHADNVRIVHANRVSFELANHIQLPPANGNGRGGDATAPPPRDESAYVFMSRLNWQERFSSSSACSRFLESCSEIDSFKPSPKRRKVHLGQWYTFWAARDAEQFDALDSEPDQYALAAIEARKAAENGRRS